MILPPDSVHGMYIWVVEWHEVSHCRTEDTGYGSIPVIAVRGAADTKYNMQVLTCSSFRDRIVSLRCRIDRYKIMRQRAYPAEKPGSAGIHT